jgi:hypothetical protein
LGQEVADQQRRHTSPWFRNNASIDIEDINDIENRGKNPHLAYKKRIENTVFCAYFALKRA